MRKKIFLMLLLILIYTISAHQPRITEEGITVIEKPEISQAFYAELKGKSHQYQINSENEFNLYVGILVPAIEGIDKDISAEITLNTEFYYYLNASESEWPEFYEEFAGDLYYWGPELGANEPLQGPKGIKSPAGTYLITVSSPDNKGKYVLVVGEKEEFPLNEMINTFVRLPKIKRFFNRPPWTAYFNKIGLFLFGIILVAILLIVFLIITFRKLKKH
jgi:hypothetical protein